MTYAYVQKGSTKMRIDSSQLRTWTDAGYQQITESQYTGSAAPTTQAPKTSSISTPAPTIKKYLTNEQDVVNNFQKYLGRSPFSWEIEKYRNQTPQSLEADLRATYKQITGHEYGQQQAATTQVPSTQAPTTSSTKPAPSQNALSNNQQSGYQDTGIAPQPHFMDGEGSLIRFSYDPDGDGPHSAKTVWLADAATKTLIPFINEDAFKNYYNGMSPSEAESQGYINIMSPNELASGGSFAGFKLGNTQTGVQSDGVIPSVYVNKDALNKLYGQIKNPQREQYGFTKLDSWYDFLVNTPNSGITQSMIQNIKDDPVNLAKHLNAVTYGDYGIDDIYRDIKRISLSNNGDKDLQNIKVIHEGISASEYHNTSEYQSAISLQSLATPPQIGDLNWQQISGLSIFQIPDDAFNIISPPIDWNDPVIKNEMDNVKSALHDVLIKQYEATTEQEKSLADSEWSRLKDEINKTYGFQLSDNAFQAFSQLEQLVQAFSDRGISMSGIESEGIDRMLRGMRIQDQKTRFAKLTDSERAERDYYINYASPEQIAMIDDEDKNLPENQKRLVKWGLKPSGNVVNFFNEEYLKQQYPKLSSQEIKNYIESTIDSAGNYRSNLYQKLAGNKLNTLYGLNLSQGASQSKESYQKDIVQQKALDAESKAYREYTSTQPNDFSVSSSSAPKTLPSTSTPSSTIAAQQTYVPQTYAPQTFVPQTSVPQTSTIPKITDNKKASLSADGSILTLPSGQRISKLDPSWEIYKRDYGL